MEAMTEPELTWEPLPADTAFLEALEAPYSHQEAPDEKKDSDVLADDNKEAPSPPTKIRYTPHWTEDGRHVHWQRCEEPITVNAKHTTEETASISVPTLSTRYPRGERRRTANATKKRAKKTARRVLLRLAPKASKERPATLRFNRAWRRHTRALAQRIVRHAPRSRIAVCKRCNLPSLSLRLPGSMVMRCQCKAVVERPM